MNYIRTPIKWVPPPAECGLLRIPADVLQMVARESAGDYFEAPVSFINQRTNLMLSCRWLNLIVEECAPMWTSYVLSPNMERAELKEMSRNFRDRTLQLRLYFFRAASPLPFRRVDPAPLDEVLAFFHRHAPQCESVNLTLDSYPQWMQVFDAFSRATYLRLKKATFNWYGENLPTRLLETVISDLPFTAAALNTLTTFRSFDMRMDWNHLSRFSSLTVLVIHFLYGDYPPTITQMAGILASSPMLVQLSLLLHIKPTPPTSPIPLLFFAIVPVLVEQVRFPAVDVLSFNFHRSDDFDIFFALATHCPVLTRMNLSGHLRNELRTRDILLAVPLLTHLDISCINGIMFKNALTGEIGQTNVVCPKLHTLTVIEYTAADIRTLVETRVALKCPLRVLNCHHLFPSSLATYHSYLDYLMDLQFVRDRVQTLNIDPEEEEWSLDWCRH